MTQNAEHMTSAMRNMILGTPSTPDPFANTPGVSKSVESEGCIDGGVPNLKARSLSFLSRQRDRHTQTAGIRDYNHCTEQIDESTVHGMVVLFWIH